MLNGEATNTDFLVFGLIRLGFEPTIYRTCGEHANHYATDAVDHRIGMFYYQTVRDNIQLSVVKVFTLCPTRSGLVAATKAYNIFDTVVGLSYISYHNKL